MTHAAAATPSGWGLAAMIMSLLLFVGLSVGAYLALVRGGRSVRGAPRARARSERLLADRFARGELDEQEYRHLVAALEEATVRGRRQRRASNSGERRR